MLPFENRIKKRKDFEKILKEGKSLHSEIFTVKFLENNLNQSRFGFIVSKKISKKAVTRNTVKRRLREQIRLRLLKFEKGLDVIIIAKKDIVKKKSEEIGCIIEKLFSKNFIEK